MSDNTNHGLCTSLYSAVTYMYALCITSLEITTAEKARQGLKSLLDQLKQAWTEQDVSNVTALFNPEMSALIRNAIPTLEI